MLRICDTPQGGRTFLDTLLTHTGPHVFAPLYGPSFQVFVSRPLVAALIHRCFAQAGLDGNALPTAVPAVMCLTALGKHDPPNPRAADGVVEVLERPKAVYELRGHRYATVSRPFSYCLRSGPLAPPN